MKAATEPSTARQSNHPIQYPNDHNDDPTLASRPTTPDSTASKAGATNTRLGLHPPPAAAPRDGNAPAPAREPSPLRSPPRRPAVPLPTVRPVPRPLPPPGPEDEEEPPNAAIPKGLRSLGVIPEIPVPEPELPPTPEHPDPVVSTPPSGIHNTPSRRAKRSKALAEKIKSSSPLKQPPLRPDERAVDGPVPIDFGGAASKKGQVTTAGGEQYLKEAEPTTAELRGLRPRDPDREKKRRRDALLAEVRALERDLAVVQKENERIRQARLARREPSPPLNGKEVLQVLRRHALSADAKKDEKEDDPIAGLLASALNPIAFLPFSKAGPVPDVLKPPAAKKDKKEGGNLPSHEPLPMTAEEALPYLQVFTPLTFTSQVSPLPQDDPDKPILQVHTITATSTSPRGLFTARIHMTVDTESMAIVELDVPRLEPAAEGELRPFIERITGKGKEENGQEKEKEVLKRGSGLYNNISVLTWAMGEWLRLAIKRARVWRTLEREVSGENQNEGVRKLVLWMRSRKKRKRRRKGGEDAGKEVDDQDGEGDEMMEEESSSNLRAADLLPFLGRRSMDFQIPALDDPAQEMSALRVSWRIRFDWTGEARSEIGVAVGVPGKCKFILPHPFRLGRIVEFADTVLRA